MNFANSRKSSRKSSNRDSPPGDAGWEEYKRERNFVNKIMREEKEEQREEQKKINRLVKLRELKEEEKREREQEEKEEQEKSKRHEQWKIDNAGIIAENEEYYKKQNFENFKTNYINKPIDQLKTWGQELRVNTIDLIPFIKKLYTNTNGGKRKKPKKTLQEKKKPKKTLQEKKKPKNIKNKKKAIKKF